jgi:WD40 repeat protein
MGDAPNPLPDASICLLEGETGTLRRRLSWPQADPMQGTGRVIITGLAFDPNTKHLAALGQRSLDGPPRIVDRGLVVWAVDTGDIVRHWELPSTGRVVFLRQGREVLAGLPSGQLHVHDLESGNLVRQAAPFPALRDFVITRDEQLLVAAGGGAIHVLRLADWTPVATIAKPDQSSVDVLALSPDSRLLASSGTDRRVILWDVQSWKKLAELPTLNSAALSLAFDSTSSHLAIGCTDEFITAWDLGLLRQGLQGLNLDWH